MNDEFFDPLDSELRRRFDAAAPGRAADPDAVLDALRPQMRRARTRHRAAIGGAVAGFLALALVAGAAISGGTSNPDVNTPPASHSSTPRPTVPDTTVPTTPTPTVDDHGSDGATTPTAPSGETGGGNGGTSGTDSGPSGGSTVTTVPAPVTQTFNSAGGSITVTLANGSLSLDGSTPAAGQYVKVNSSSGDRVEVEFYSRPDFGGGRTSRIRVDLANGTMAPIID